jgi:quercetin dioxygenase-like cupin family protein
VVTATTGYVLTKDTGVQDVWFPYPGGQTGRYSIKVTGEQTDGRLAQVHIIDELGAAAPMHLHHGYNEAIYLIDGEMSFFLGDERIEARAGDFMIIPQGVVHSFLVRSERAEWLLTLAPARLEGFFAEIGVPVVPGEPKPGPIATDPEEMTRKAAAYGAEIIGPPPSL